MAHARCGNCGCFRAPVTDQPSLFDAALPVPAVDDRFAAFHRESLRREAEARRKGVCRVVGAERQARRRFTHEALGLRA